MGMVWVARLADDAQVAALRNAPDDIYDFVNADEGYENGTAIEMDKEWHAVHYLLTGSAGDGDSPLNFILGDFEPLGEDNGYGPAWYVPAEAILAFHLKISSLSDLDIARKYNPNAMVDDQVYLAETLRDEGEEALQYLMDHVGRLREFMRKAATSNLSAFGLIT